MWSSGLSAVLEGALWPRLALDDAAAINRALVANRQLQGRFANLALLYDRLTIPTSDFGIVAAIARWIGLKEFRQALDDHSISFVRYLGCMAYVGGGVGVSNAVVRNSSQRPLSWWQEAIFGDFCAAIEQQVHRGCDFIPFPERKALVRALKARSKEFWVRNEEFIGNIAHEAYRDTIGDPELTASIGGSNGLGNLEMNMLPGLRANEARFSSFDGPRDAIGVVLRAAEMNLEIMISQSVPDCDWSTFDDASRLLTNKLRRAGVRQAAIEGFCNLLELRRVPNIVAAIERGVLNVRDVWPKRKTRSAREFRRWVRSVRADGSDDLARLYVDALEMPDLSTHVGVKAIRWAVTTGAPEIIKHAATTQFGPIGSTITDRIAGPVAGFIDTFFVDKWLKGYSPRLFIDELKKIRIEPCLSLSG